VASRSQWKKKRARYTGKRTRSRRWECRFFPLSFLMSFIAGPGQAGAGGVAACHLRTDRGRGGR
jgi:hypothetical protein